MAETKTRRARILQGLRGGGLVTANRLAAKFKVCTRTIYRDINELKRQGQPIMGEAGVGYILRREVRHG